MDEYTARLAAARVEFEGHVFTLCSDTNGFSLELVVDGTRGPFNVVVGRADAPAFFLHEMYHLPRFVEECRPDLRNAIVDARLAALHSALYALVAQVQDIEPISPGHETKLEWHRDVFDLQPGCYVGVFRLQPTRTMIPHKHAPFDWPVFLAGFARTHTMEQGVAMLDPDPQLGLATLRERHDALQARFDVLEAQWASLNDAMQTMLARDSLVRDTT